MEEMLGIEIQKQVGQVGQCGQLARLANLKNMRQKMRFHAMLANWQSDCTESAQVSFSIFGYRDLILSPYAPRKFCPFLDQTLGKRLWECESALISTNLKKERRCTSLDQSSLVVL